eukprot:COSAG02_NODE_1093_length_14617_cov_13.078661_3_plen_765_part_00
MTLQSRVMRASDLVLIGQPKDNRGAKAKPTPVGPRQRMKDERLASCLAMKAAIDETEDNALRCSISAQSGIVPSRNEANWEVTSPAASPVASPARPPTSSTASLEYLAGSPEHIVYDPTTPMEWSEAGPVMQHRQIGQRFSFHQLAGKRAELAQENESKRFAQNQLLAEVLAEAKAAEAKIAAAALARKCAAKDRKEAYAAKMEAAIRGLATPPDPEPECDERARPGGTDEEPRLWRAPTEPPPRSWWPSAWVYGTDESVERVDEGEAATKKQHQRYYGKVHAGYRDVMPGLPPKTYNLVSSYMYPERERMGRLDALRELPPGLRPENDTALQTIRVRTPNSKYANENSQINSPAMTKRFIFRSEERAGIIHGLERMPELPVEIAPATNPVATKAAIAETEERLAREAQDPERSGDCLLGYRPPSSGMVADGLHPKQADETALRGLYEVPREYANLPHRGCGPLDAAGSPRVDTTGYFPDSAKPVKMDGEPVQHAPTPAGGYYVSQAGVPMVGRVSGEAGVPRRDRPVGRQDDKTRRQDGRATLRGSTRWLGNRQGEYSFAKTNANSKEQTTPALRANEPAQTSTASAASRLQDVSAAISLPSEPSQVLASPISKAQEFRKSSPMSTQSAGDSPIVMRSASVPLLGRTTHGIPSDTTSNGTTRGGKTATPGGIAGRAAMGAVARASLKKKVSKGAIQLGGSVSGWRTTGSLNRSTGSTAGDLFDSLSALGKTQADPAVRWYGKQAKGTAIARNQANRDASCHSL